GYRVPFPETVVGGAHRPRVALLRKLEVGGALDDPHFKFVTGRAKLQFAPAQRFLSALPGSRAPANSYAGQCERQKARHVEKPRDQWIIHYYQMRQCQRGKQRGDESRARAAKPCCGDNARQEQRGWMKKRSND